MPDRTDRPPAALAHGAAKSSDIERVRRDVDRAEMCVARADEASAARRSARLRREAGRKPDAQS